MAKNDQSKRGQAEQSLRSKAELDSHETVSVTLSGERGLLREVASALEELIGRFGEKPRIDIATGSGDCWSQSGGWYQVIGGWSQSGGWVLDCGQQPVMRPDGPPREVVVRDVWAALERVKPDPESPPKGWGPLPFPKAGPDPSPERRQHDDD